MYRKIVPPGKRLLEIGCGQGDLLAALGFEQAVGVDFSANAIHAARQKHPELTFVHAEACEYLRTTDDGPFDVIILSDLLDELYDIQQLLELLRRVSHDGTRLVCNFYSKAWQPLLSGARRLGLARKLRAQNWLTREDVRNLLHLTGWDMVTSSKEILLPARLPFASWLCNRYLVKMFPWSLMALTNVFIARPGRGTARYPRRHSGSPDSREPKVSVIVAARNEQGHIADIFKRLPKMGRATELVFVEGGSSDDTYGEIQRQMDAHPHVDARLFRQSGKGKGDAVRKGFGEATGDILMILDADLTMPPEDLPKYYRALVDNRGEFINGVRLVYPMEDRAMRFCNLVANKFFGAAFSWILGQTIKDTLCGTKVLWASDYERIAANRSYFGDFDPFGDFDLIFGAARLRLKHVDLPIRYRERVYGDTNIARWSSGVLLLRMVVFAARRLKFR